MDRMETDFPVLLRAILENLDTKSLRSCRLVSKAWNYEANRALSKHLTIPLESLEQLQNYSATFENSIQPISIRFESFRLGMVKLLEVAEENLHFGGLDLLGSALTRFTELSGHNVRSLEAAVTSVAVNLHGDLFNHSAGTLIFERLCRMIYESFVNLKSLRLEIDVWVDTAAPKDLDFNLEEFFSSIPTRELPNLKEMTFTLNKHCRLTERESQKSEEMLDTFLKTLFASAINLKSIAISSWSAFAKNKLMEHFQFLTSSMRSLTIKETELNDIDLRVIGSHTFSNLEHVKITLHGKVSEDALKEFLQRYRHSLRSLHLSFTRKEVSSSSRRPHVFERNHPQFPPPGVPMIQLEQLTLDLYSNGAVVWENLPKLQKLVLRRCMEIKQICSISNNNNLPQQDLSILPRKLSSFEVFEFRNEAEEFPFMEPYQFSFLTTLTISCVPNAPLSTIFEWSKLLRHLTVSGCPRVNDKSICGIGSSLLETISVGDLQRDSTAEAVEAMITMANAITREGPYIGDLKNLQSLTLNADLGDSSVLFGIVQCHQLKRLNLGSWSQRLTWRTDLIIKYGLKFLVEAKVKTKD